MKRNHKHMWRTVIALALVFTLVFGTASTAFAGSGVSPNAAGGKETINYVSIGDSMANGYCFVDYAQDSNDRNVYDVMTGKGMYGRDAYPLQFENYLTEKGYDVNHTQLATSAMLAEDLLYLLDGRDEFDDGWSGYKDYVGTYTDAELKPHFQKAITEANVITMGIGNASFGAFMLDRVTSALGVFGASLEGEPVLNFEEAIAVLDLDEEQYAEVMKLYNDFEAGLDTSAMEEFVAAEDLDAVVDIVAYTAATFIVNYKLLMEKIMEMNPDAEIILVELLNTTYGMKITDENGEVLVAFGDLMDSAFDILNAYMAAVPSTKQADGEWLDAKFYYAEQPDPEFICLKFKELKDAEWGNIDKDRLSGKTVRNRNISAFNDSLAEIMGAPFAAGINGAVPCVVEDMLEGMIPNWNQLGSEEKKAYINQTIEEQNLLIKEQVYGENYKNFLPKITLADVQAFEATPPDEFVANGNFNNYTNRKNLSIALYLGIESAVAESIDTMNIPLEGLITIANNIESAFEGFNTSLSSPASVAKEMGDYLVSTDVLKGMCKIYGLFKVGNGMSVHPTPSAHDKIAESVINAYETGYTSNDETKALLLDYMNKNYPNLMEAIGSTQGVTGNVDDLEIIVAMLKASNSPALEGADIDALEAQIRELNRYVDTELTPEDQAFVMELSNDLMDRTQNLASKATYFKYEPTEESVYVALGDANANVNAPAELAKKLFGEDYEKFFAPKDEAGMTCEKMLALLDDEDYAAELEKADLISVALGSGDVTTFVTERLTADKPAKLDWTKVGIESNNTLKELNEFLDMAVPIVDALGLADKYMPEGMEVENPAKFARTLVESLLYGYASYNKYYTQVLDKIHEINPEAQLMVLGMFNPVDDWTYVTDVTGTEKIVPIGGVTSNLIESANIKTLAYALTGEKTTFVDLSDNVTSLDDAIANGEEPGFAEYFKAVLGVEGEKAVITAEGQEYMTEQMYAALQENYLDNEIKVTVEYLLPLIIKYYDEAYMYAYRYAKDQGYIDEAVKGIDTAIEAVKELQKLLDEYTAADLGMTEELFNDIKAQIPEIIETLEQAKVLILEADVLDQATLDELLALLNEAGQDMALLGNTLAQAGTDTYNLVIKPALDEAYAILINEVLPQVNKQLQIAVKAGTEWLLEKLGVAYEEFVEWMINEALPGADKAMYDWLYNNPETVINFFMEYGDDMMPLIEEYGDEVVGLLAYALYLYGPDAVEWALENPEEAIDKWVQWYDKHGHKVWPMIKQYLKTLDEMGAFDDLKDAIDKAPELIAGAMDKLNQLLKEYGDEIMAYIYDNAANIAKDLLKALGDLEADVKAEIEKFVKEAYKQIEKLEAQLEALKEAAEKAHGKLKEQIEKQIAQIEKQIETLKAQIKFIEDKAKELYDAIKDAEAAVKELIEAIEKGTTEGIKAALSAIKDAMDKVAAAIDIVKDIVNEINAAIDKAIAIIEKIEKAYKDTVAMLKKIDADIKDLIEDIEEAVAAIEKAVNAFNAAAKEAVAELDAFIKEVKASLEALYADATTGHYIATGDSYYVALGDTEVEYAQIVADELDLDKDQFVNAGIDGMRAEDLRMILDENYAADAYGQAMFGAEAADLRAEYIAEIEKADFITLGFSNNTMTEFVATQVAEGYEMDWARYIGKDGAAAMKDAVAEIKAVLAENGIGEEISGMLLTAVESYAYAYTGFACNYPEAVNLIKAINPEAEVVVVGMYNPFENAVIDVDGTEVAIGEFIGALVDIVNVHYTGYAMITGNATFVAAPAVETKAPFGAAVGAEDFIGILADMDVLEPSEAGHQYIAEQILDAMNVVSKAVYDAQKLIDQIKDFGPVTRDNLEDAKALAEAAREAWDKLTDEEKELIGLEGYKVLVDFELAIAKVELGIAEDIAAAEKALAEKEAQLADIERALKITESTVTDLKAKVINKSQVKVTWTPAEITPDQYRVTLLRAGKKVSTTYISGEKNSVVLKNLLRGTNFTVRVTPVAKVDDQKYFSIYKTSNKVKTQLQKANLTVKKAGLKKQIISKDQNSTGFQIYISKDKNFKKNVKKLVYKTNKKGLNVKVKAKNFKKGTNYVKVRAYTKVNGKTVYGAWSGTVKVVK